MGKYTAKEETFRGQDIRAEKKTFYIFTEHTGEGSSAFTCLGCLASQGFLSGTISRKRCLYRRGRRFLSAIFLPVTKTVKSGDGTVESFGMLSTKECGTYEMEVRLLGIIPVGDVTVHIVDDTQVIPGGVPIGIYVHTDGVLVVDAGDVETENGSQKSPARHILKAGDYILAVNGQPVSEKEELIRQVNASGGEAVVLTVSREGEQMECEVTPVNCGNGQYRIGAWVRDDMAGSAR